MLKNNLQPQCYDCNDIDIETDTTRLYSMGEVIQANCAVWCSHDKVCKKIEAKTPKGADIDA